MKKALAFRKPIHLDSGSPLLVIACQEISPVAVRSSEGGETYLKTLRSMVLIRGNKYYLGGERKGDNVIQSRL